MAGGEGNLGFAAVGALLLLLLVGPALLIAVVRRRWRLASARAAEVARLARLAAREAAEAEAEMVALAYGPDQGLGYDCGPATVAAERTQSCAVCFSPTTMRCSKCKAVKYCSGTCQIFHWRQGHKDVCRPPLIDDPYNGEGSGSALKTVQTDQSDLRPNSLGIEDKLHAKCVETPDSSSPETKISSKVFVEDGKPEVKAFVDTSGTGVTIEPLTSSSSSSSCSVDSGHMETSDGSSANKDPPPLHNARSESGDTASFDSPSKAVNAGEKNATIAPSKFSSDRLSMNGVYSTININQKISSFETKDVEIESNGFLGSGFSENCKNAKPSDDYAECSEVIHDSNVAQRASNVDATNSKNFQERDRFQLDPGSPSEPSNLPGQCVPSQASSRGDNSSNEDAVLNGRAESESRITKDLGFDKPASAACGIKNDIALLKSEGTRSSSSVFSANRASSGGGVHSISNDTSLKVDNACLRRANSSGRRDSLPNGVSHWKTSVRRVVQQFKYSNYSRQYPSEFGNAISGKYKMLFPYDLFIKLYNSDKVELRPCGLQNCGNSCYANAVLQCLAFTRPLTGYLLQGFHTRACPKEEWCFTCELESLVMEAKQGKSPLSPSGILSHIDNIGGHLAHGREEDAHEFLRYAIETMQSVCLKEAGAKEAGSLVEETTLVQQTFGGYLRSKIKCMKCHGKSVRNEKMLDLTVEIHGDIGTLEEALRRFTTYELLDGDNKYHCSRCKSYEQARKKLTISEAPNILTIALKRFQSGKFGKLNKAVRFPELLNLSPCMSGTNDKLPIYQLYAVVVHQDVMNATFSGHYVCYVKSTQGKWYKVDDSRVEPVELGKVLRKTAYLLFYARCSPRGPSLLRKALSHDYTKVRKSRGKDAADSGHSEGSSTSSNRSSPMILRPGSTVTRQSFGPSDFFDARFFPLKADGSSDSSSLLSCSDEGSSSTDSTRDSTSTEFSEYIFGDPGQLSLNSPLRFSEDSDGLAYSPLASSHSSEAVLDGHASDLNYEADHKVADGATERRPQGSGTVGFEGEEGPLFLYSDTTNYQCRESLKEQGRTRESDLVNSTEVRPSVLIRRSTRERTGLTSY